MATPGRKPKLTDDKISVALKLAAENKSISYICRFLDIERKTYYNWCSTNPELKEIMDAELAEARKRELEKVHKALFKMTQKHKLKTVKTMYDANDTPTGKIVEEKEIDPNVNAINSYLDRNEEKTTDSEETTINIINDFGED